MMGYPFSTILSLIGRGKVRGWQLHEASFVSLFNRQACFTLRQSIRKSHSVSYIAHYIEKEELKAISTIVHIPRPGVAIPPLPMCKYRFHPLMHSALIKTPDHRKALPILGNAQPHKLLKVQSLYQGIFKFRITQVLSVWQKLLSFKLTKGSQAFRGFRLSGGFEIGPNF